MKRLQFLNAPSLFIEIGHNALHACDAERGVDLPLERATNGQLTAACEEAVIHGLKAFVQKKVWQPQVRALCAIGARGVSIRRLSLPMAAPEESKRLLLLQIESEFPLSPDQLAWGSIAFTGTSSETDAAPKQTRLVAAVKKEVVEDYARILAACGISATFTLAAFARAALCTQPGKACAFLEIQSPQSELLVFENGSPSTLRTLPEPKESNISDASLDSLAQAIKSSWTGAKLYLSGLALTQKELPAKLGKRLSSSTTCESLDAKISPGHSAATLGLKKFAEAHNGEPPLVLDAKTVQRAVTLADPALRKRIAITAGLLLGLLAFPYLEAVVLKPRLARQLTELENETNRLSTIDREMSFLQNLKQSQPPYLDALYLFSKSAPQGTRIDSLSMNRKGDVTLRASFRDAMQVADFRTKLMGSGFFSLVTAEEQVPTPDHQKLNVRLNAQWKSAAARAGLSFGPSASEKAKETKDNKDGKSSHEKKHGGEDSAPLAKTAVIQEAKE